MRCYHTPVEAELLMCPGKAYVSANLLTGLQNAVLLSRHDNCDIAVDSNAPLSSGLLVR